MEEYLQQGAELGLLLDPFERKVYFYRANAAPHVVDDPATITAEPTLPQFALSLNEIW